MFPIPDTEIILDLRILEKIYKSVQQRATKLITSICNKLYENKLDDLSIPAVESKEKLKKINCQLIKALKIL